MNRAARAILNPRPVAPRRIPRGISLTSIPPLLDPLPQEPTLSTDSLLEWKPNPLLPEMWHEEQPGA